MWHERPIEAILHQRLTTADIAGLIVVTSGCRGCTDEPVSIVAGVAQDEARVRLHQQAHHPLWHGWWCVDPHGRPWMLDPAP